MMEHEFPSFSTSKNERTNTMVFSKFSLGGEWYRGDATHPRTFPDVEVALSTVPRETAGVGGLSGWVSSVALGSFFW